ncbi:MAG: hypothetical protein AB7N91_22720 [Candidatus Tectimicrobiota bacterium]
MPKVHVTSHIELDLEDILQSVARLETTELEQFVAQVLALQAQRRAPSVPRDETALLQQINGGLPADIRQRYAVLNARLHEETITPEEHAELLTLIDRLELADAERMRGVIALAQLRGVSVDTLIEQLGLRRTTYA